MPEIPRLDIHRHDCIDIGINSVCSPKTEESPAVSLDLRLPQAQCSGSVSLETLDDFLAKPTLKVGLGGIKAYVELDIKASAPLVESIELFASPELSIDLLNLLDVELKAALALDLVLAVDAAIDVTAGFYLSFSDDSWLEVSLLTKEIVNSSLEGLTAHAIPIGIGADVDLSAAITLGFGLRLRSQVGVSADLDIVGLDILGADAIVAVWVNLFDYTAVLVATDDCLVSIKEELALAAGVAVSLDVDVLDILDISLAPTVFVTLSKVPLLEVCLDVLPEPSYSAPAASATLTGTASSPAITHTPAQNATGSATTSADGGLVTSVTSVTHTYTITSCAASVTNCPASHTQKVITSTVDVYTTICPATQTAAPTTPTTPTTTSTPVPVKTMTETLTTIVPCESPSSTTFTPPTTAHPPPTVVIDDTTTVCPATETPTSGGPTSIPAMTTPALTTPGLTTPAAPGTTGPAVVPTQPGVPVVTVPGTAPNSTWTSIKVQPSASWTAPAAPPATPSVPAVGGAASFKIGMAALAVPAVLVAML